jgi:hypothetical protein
MDDYLQRNPDKRYASYYQTVASWIREKMVDDAKAKGEQQSALEWFANLTDEELKELET